MNANQNPLILAIAAVVSAAAGKSANASKAGESGKSATAALRDFALLSADAGVPVQRAQDALKAAFVKANMKAGTAKPYVRALGGFRQAIAEGDSITDTGDGKAMTVPQANIYLLPKADRDVEKRLTELRAEIAKRVRAIKNVTELAEFRDLLPEVKGEVKTVEVAQDAADILADFLTDDETAEDVAEAQAA